MPWPTIARVGRPRTAPRRPRGCEPSSAAAPPAWKGRTGRQPAVRSERGLRPRKRACAAATRSTAPQPSGVPTRAPAADRSEAPTRPARTMCDRIARRCDARRSAESGSGSLRCSWRTTSIETDHPRSSERPTVWCAWPTRPCAESRGSVRPASDDSSLPPGARRGWEPRGSNASVGHRKRPVTRKNTLTRSKPPEPCAQVRVLPRALCDVARHRRLMSRDILDASPSVSRWAGSRFGGRG